jgi:NAD+ synthase (glutamine-hydrolysing)
MKFALIPIDPIIGDFEGNLEIHKRKIDEAAGSGAEICAFPELSLVGYHPKDLLRRRNWNVRAEEQLNALHTWLQKQYPNLAVIVGTTHVVENKSSISPRGLLNVGIFLCGKQKEIRGKTLIPYYDVFFENRYFDSALEAPEEYRAPILWKKKKIGIVICEDSWSESLHNGKKIHQCDPTSALVESGAEWIFNLSASPYSKTKKAERRKTLLESSKKHAARIFYVNQYGSQDEILFDGDAFVVDSGKIESQRNSISEKIYYGHDESKVTALAELARMIEEGIRGYARKNGFDRIVLGLSGGIDSALVATLAVNALGAERVIGVSMPSKFSSVHSVEDAEALARNLGISLKHVPIKMFHSTVAMALKPFFQGKPEDTTEENVQSRLRGIVVMAFANKFQALALATGNKSEFAMGYSTLYGDMCGALAPIGDLYKEEVYALARFLNSEKEVIPENTFIKPPSAELRPNQTDQDTLPPYDLLDSVLKLLIEEEKNPEQIETELKKKFPKIDLQLIKKVQNSLEINEYKRKQAPPILRLSERAFGSGRPIPLTHRW